MSHRLRTALGIATFAMLSPLTSLAGQSPDSACGYSRCALSIAPRLTGLDIVRGDGENRIASLAFLWPHDVAPVFATDSIARRFASVATHHRRWGAVMTDAGVALIAVGLAHAAIDGRHLRGSSAYALLGGIGLVGVSVPVHFDADGNLSRAVWRYNQRFSR